MWRWGSPVHASGLGHRIPRRPARTCQTRATRLARRGRRATCRRSDCLCQRRLCSTVACLQPIQARIIDIGGSHAQREIFSDILLDAALQTGAYDVASALLDTKRRHRPDRPWPSLLSRNSLRRRGRAHKPRLQGLPLGVSGRRWERIRTCWRRLGILVPRHEQTAMTQRQPRLPDLSALFDLTIPHGLAQYPQSATSSRAVSPRRGARHGAYKFRRHGSRVYAPPATGELDDSVTGKGERGLFFGDDEIA